MSTKHEHDYYESSRPEMLAFIPTGAKRVLELGCAAGEFGQTIKMRQSCEVWGIEYNEDQARKAMQRLDRVVTGDVMRVLKDLPRQAFDCIVCNDILEHLVDPFTLIRDCRDYVAPGGHLVASIPNVRYYRVLKDLLLHGAWEYKDSGVLDRTHLRFFTRRSIMKLFPGHGWEILRLEGINPTSSSTYRLVNALLLGAIDDVRYRQFAVVCRPSAA